MEVNKIIEQCNDLLDDETYFLQTIELTKDEVKVLINEIKCLQYIINDVYSSIQHELHAHILHHDEDSWNPEYYTNDKLDYRKLLIGLLSDYENRLSKGEDKEWKYTTN